MSDSEGICLVEETPPPANAVKLSVIVSAESIEKLKAIATLRGTTTTEVIRQAHAMLIYIDNEHRQGNKFLVKRGSKYSELILS